MNSPGTSPSTYEQVLEYYREHLSREEATVKRVSNQWTMVGYIRGVLFLAALATFLFGFAQAWGIGTAWWVISAVLTLAFIVVAIYHEGMHEELHRATLLSKMDSESLARCQREWDKIKVPPIEIPKEFAPISKDLDLLGTSSVYKLVGVTRTPLGTDILRQWIIQGGLEEEIKLRQEAVAEMRPEFEWRRKFRLLCERLVASRSGPSRFVEWCESPNWFEGGRQWVLWLARLTGIASILAIIFLFTGLVPFATSAPIVMVTLIITAVINFAISVLYSGSIHEIFNQVSSRADEANHYVSLFDMVCDYPAKSTKLKQLQQQLQPTEDGAQKSIGKLGRYVWLANMRRNGFAFVPYMILNFLVFWDAHALHFLEKWKSKHGENARLWFNDLGEWEAICALAKLAGDHPEWTFPEIAATKSADAAILSGTKVGHPLLNRSRVCNDVQIGPPGTVLLVTGSNMSGKSTLLRSVGANVVLGQMGSVVCADKLVHPPLHIETSMRIDDSLADGVSFFMAELKRLKQVVDTARDHDGDNPRRMLFLLDEILQGTNSRERQIAVSRVVRKLIDENAIGAISTHDLDLATTDELTRACQTVHFSEQFHEVDGKKQMTFDYVMKSGIAETTNALKLLEMVGLGEDES